MTERPPRQTAGRLWGGRFKDGPAAEVVAFTDSLAVDRRLFAEDVAGSIAHADMLASAGIITVAESRKLVRALRVARRELAAGAFEFAPGDEDIHTAVERRVNELAGPAVGGKLHTGRSRNDQVALDLRLYSRSRLLDLVAATAVLREALLARARQHSADLFPAYTHLQRAQPTTIGHHLLAYVAMLERDAARLRDAYARVDVLPLGSAAATGTSLPLRREEVAARLGFRSISSNSLDAVGDRDFVVEIEAACALLMVHLSRLGEEFVLWSSQEFSFVELPDAYSTGSSLMPQKKNPDIAELVRGKTGRVVGALVAMLTTLKGLPLAYNRDLQEDKQGFFDAVDTALGSLRIATALVSRSRFRLGVAAAAASDPAMLATEVADHLVREGVPFRRAHEVVGAAVRLAADRGATLADLSLSDWQGLEPAFKDSGLASLDAARAVARRTLPGSPGPAPLARAISTATTRLRGDRAWLEGRAKAILLP